MIFRKAIGISDNQTCRQAILGEYGRHSG
ncbi:hypothetical protein A2U01_0024289, partial [Trifolium medium]|nr:hypothetical protein [Trifolium medium]